VTLPSRSVIKKSLFALALALACSCTSLLTNAASAQGAGQKPFKIKIDKNDVRTPTLDRNHDIHKNNVDPFDGTEENTTLDVPRSTFEPEVVRPPKPVKPFQLDVKQEYTPPPQMQQAQPVTAPGPGMEGAEDPIPMQQQFVPNQGNNYDPNDPDQTQELQLLWDMWHKRVAAVIFDRYNFFAKAAFKFSPPLTAKVSYSVTRDGRIQNIRLDQAATNPLFNILVTQCIKSLDGDAATLQFPPTSRRMTVQKYGTFAQNWGGQAGFRYQNNDVERYKQRMQQQQQRPY
jgi:hypothetical protein